MKLSIVIVSWNVKEDLANCLRSIEENPASGQFEVIVTDNASSDETAEFVRNKFADVVIIANSQNLGFAAANNQGIEKSQGEYILLLNPDTIVHSGTLDVLIEFMDENKDVGVCGPKLLNADGSIQRSVRRYPSFRGALHRHTAFKSIGVFKSEYKKWLMKDFGQDGQKDVDQLMGAALVIRKSVLDEVGGMDERFFMYYEEVDLCYRVKQAGWRVVFLPQADITHLGGRSSEQIPVEKQIMAMASLLKFFRKHRGKYVTAIFNCVFKPAIILRAICDTAATSIAYLYGLMAMDKGRRRKSAAKISNSLKLVCVHGWQILFKM